MSKRQSQGKVKLPKFELDQAKTVDFSLIAYFRASLIFITQSYVAHFYYELFRVKSKIQLRRINNIDSDHHKTKNMFFLIAYYIEHQETHYVIVDKEQKAISLDGIKRKINYSLELSFLWRIK